MPEPLLPPDPAASVATDFQRVRTLGAAMASRLHGVLRAMRLYDTGNRALRSQQQELLDAIHAMESDEVSVLGMGEYLYVNGVRLRAEGSQLAVFRTLLTEFEERQLGGLRFTSGLQLEELEAFMRAFHADRSATSTATLEEEASRATVRNVWTVRIRPSGFHAASEGDSEPGPHDRHRTRLVFQKAVSGTRELMLRTARTGRPAMQQARRVVQSLVDHLLTSGNTLVEFTALKRHDEYTYAHSVNVSILSIRMGQVLGFSRTELAGIGVAGLLHDTGKISVPAEILGKPGPLDPDEWTLLRRHPLEGFRIVSRLPGISELMLDAMRAALEHHMNVDHTGYPAVAEPRDMGAFSRIIAVADCFDAVTGHRAYRSRPMTPNEALRLLLGREFERFDRAALWALVRTVGLYPAGTLLRTGSGRLLLSVAPNPDDPRRPVCRELVTAPEGGIVAAADEFTLDEGETVARVLAPEDAGVDVQSLLAA